jgi:hypothetical protein
MDPMRRLMIFATLFTCISLAAAPAITSVRPTTGPTSGGTVVTITGSGFSSAQSPRVSFGPETLDAVATVVNATTLTATTPPSLPGTFDVTVLQRDGYATVSNAFTYVGPVPEAAYERILVPLLIPPAAGAFGARFETELTLSTRQPLSQVTVHGLNATCLNLPCVRAGKDTVHVGFDYNSITPDGWVLYEGTPGRFLYVRKDKLPELYGHLRVRDVTRERENLGTEIPLVRSGTFTTGDLMLRNEHPGPDYRTTLRIYAPEAAGLSVSIRDWDGNVTTRDIVLTAGATIYEPAYAVIGDFPANWMSVLISPPPPPPVDVNHIVPYWAFVSVTNNETQMITTITPQP